MYYIFVSIGFYFSLATLVKFFENTFIKFLKDFIPFSALDKFNFFSFNELLNIPRFEIWLIAIKLIQENPIFGVGKSTFASMYKINGGISNIQHTHNIIIELAYSFGIPTAILFLLFIIFLYKESFLNIFKSRKKYDFDKIWFISTFIIILSQLYDMTYYDGKVCLLIWILLAGLKTISNENSQKVV